MHAGPRVHEKRSLSVYVSSTGRDLAAHRRAVLKHMQGLDRIHCHATDFGARDKAAFDHCREQIDNCDIFVGLVGHDRGWEPPDDAHPRSITELEYEWAAGKPRLMFVAPEGRSAETS